MAEFEQDLLNPSTALDASIVRACRKVVASLLVEKQAEEFNGLSVRDAVLFAYEDVT